MNWKPISEEEIKEDIKESVEKLSEAGKKFWNLIKIPPEKWQLNPWGDEGGGFWVVALAGKNVLYYNDIEDGYNNSSFTTYGTIDSYVCEQVNLEHVINFYVSLLQEKS